jgi:dihydroorotase
MAVEYRKKLVEIEPSVLYLMTLYLSPSLTPEEIRKAAKSGIFGVKSYPRGVTTNSDSGIESYDVYYPVFKAMEEEGLVLHLHGEVPSDHDKNICVLNAEEHFLQHLRKLHNDFPKLKIVLEHATTKAAVETVKSLGDTVGCTITLHHLVLTVDDWAGKCHGFCKPVAKYPTDRNALRDVVKSGHPRFFFGSDSAPHPRTKKEGAVCAAGIFTMAHSLPTLIHVLESFGALDKYDTFACRNGREFFGTERIERALKQQQQLVSAKDSELLSDTKGTLNLKNTAFTIPAAIAIKGENDSIVPFMSGQEINWKLE